MPAHQVLQEPVLPGREADGGVAAAHAVADGVQGQRAKCHDDRPGGRSAPDQRPDPGHQHQEAERLGEVVISAQVEGIGLVVFAVLGREHQHRSPDLALPQFLQDVVAVHPRQHEVQQDRIVRVLQRRRQSAARRRGRRRRRTPRSSARGGLFPPGHAHPPPSGSAIQPPLFGPVWPFRGRAGRNLAGPVGRDAVAVRSGLLGRTEQPPRNVAAQDHVRSAGGTDAPVGDVVAAPGSGAAGCAVDGVGQAPGQVPAGAQGPQFIEFVLRSRPSTAAISAMVNPPDGWCGWCPRWMVPKESG